MKSTFAFFLVFSLLLFANISYARKDLEEYWKNMMKGQPMPGAIKDLLVQDPQSESDEIKNPFISDFNVKPSVIIYHSHDKSNKQKRSVKNFK
ncbi:hypothetical protein L6164_035578 [Bauhinia variegata]|uniref:Uncharacterized protein n=1 Tax=Bauhinia variegata TaxID=167791 RepID=A0ACB9KED1_BAUVA|nr:hypothetical protein L6164_035578 [Bauhinia variegata]